MYKQDARSWIAKISPTPRQRSQQAANRSKGHPGTTQREALATAWFANAKDVFDLVEELPNPPFEIPFDLKAEFHGNPNALCQYDEEMWCRSKAIATVGEKAR